MASTITATDVVAEYGAYYINSGQNTSRVLKLLKQKTETVTHAKRIITGDTVYRQSEALITEILQPFQNTWTSKGNTTFKPRDITLRPMKIDWQGVPDKLKESWLGFLADFEEKDRKKWPFVRWLIEEMLITQSEHDREKAAYFYGEYVAPVEGVAGNAADVMDGIKKLLDDGIDGATMNEVSLDAITPSNIFDLVEEFTDSIPDEYDMVPMKLFMSRKNFRDYFRDKRNTHGGNTNFQDSDRFVDYRENIEIVGLPSMAGSDYLFATPKNNFLWCTNGSVGRPQIEGVDRTVKVYTDWYEGLGFGLDEMVFVSRPAASGSGSAS